MDVTVSLGDLFDSDKLSKSVGVIPARMLATASSFSVLLLMSWIFCNLFVQKFEEFKVQEKLSFIGNIGTFSFAIAVCYLAAGIIFFPEDAILSDRLYGQSERANNLFGITCGWLALDTLLIILHRQSEPVVMVLHHIACIICYILVQTGFLHYYSVRLLLFEASTPFLSIRWALQRLDKKNSWLYGYMEYAFGIVFLAARVLYGVPLSYFALTEVFHAYTNGQLRSIPVATFIVICNFGMNALNLHWASILLKKFVQKKKS